MTQVYINTSITYMPSLAFADDAYTCTLYTVYKL